MIGIAIVNYKTWETTLRCVASIERVCTRPFHIYLVDNHSPNDALRALREAYREDGNVTVLDAGKNGGYGFGLNCGIRAAIADGCDAIIASNNDIIYLEGAIETMYDCLTSSPQIGCAGAAQRTESGGEMYSAQFAPDTALSMALRWNLGAMRAVCAAAGIFRSFAPWAVAICCARRRYRRRASLMKACSCIARRISSVSGCEKSDIQRVCVRRRVLSMKREKRQETAKRARR